ncbi:ecotropic viral integration site 5 ortholog-like isoform X1 [Tigriopus californicus]|nr:ecotropic viral integration site 5 ortholog-like isoform X1 [Tigriopus californicus]
MNYYQIAPDIRDFSPSPPNSFIDDSSHVPNHTFEKDEGNTSFTNGLSDEGHKGNDEDEDEDDDPNWFLSTRSRPTQRVERLAPHDLEDGGQHVPKIEKNPSENESNENGSVVLRRKKTHRWAAADAPNGETEESCSSENHRQNRLSRLFQDGISVLYGSSNSSKEGIRATLPNANPNHERSELPDRDLDLRKKLDTSAEAMGEWRENGTNVILSETPNESGCSWPPSPSRSPLGLLVLPSPSSTYIDDPIATRICELFDELQPLELEEEPYQESQNVQLQRKFLSHRRQREPGFFKRRKQTVSGYFSDWAKWLTNTEANEGLTLDATTPSTLQAHDNKAAPTVWSMNQSNGNIQLDSNTTTHGPPKLGENGLIETDAKSLNSLQSGHSRRNSDASQISVTSGSSFPEREESTEEDLWTLWGKIINEWDSAAKRKLPHVKELVRRGIPHHFRGVAWPLLCGAHESADKPRYAEYMKTQSAHEKVIRRDIARTYPEHEFFKKKDGVGQEALFNVMKAYSIHDREVGYCQGSAFIVGLLLMQMPEEEAFCVLVKLMQEYRMREMFKPSMAELGLCMYQLEVLVQEHIPDLYAHFQSQSIHTNLYASSWFLTIFSTSVPIALACRIMDCFLADGIEVIFRLALALLLIGRSELLVQDMEGVIRYFQRDMPTKFETDPETVFNLAFSLKINQKKMKKLEKEYTTMKTKEKEDEIELRRLRTENRLLRQRVDLLEQESSNLADRLIQGQVTRAEVEESTFAIKRELAAVKQHDLDTNSQLDEAKDRIRKLSAIIEDPEKLSSKEDISLKSEVIKQKEEMIHCLQDELIKERLREAENEEKIRDLHQKVADLEADMKKMRDAVPENDVASLQEELAAAKLREAEANLALKELRCKVSELSAMWQKHIKRADGEANGDSLGVMAAPSTPKKLLGSLLEGGKAAEAAKLEEELLTSRMSEVEGQADLKEQKLKVMELETQNHVIANQLKRQSDEVSRLREAMEKKAEIEGTLQQQVKEAKRKYADLEGRMKEDLMMARIRDAENTQCVAELTQKISSLEYKNQEMLTEGDLATSMDQSYKMRELQDKIASLRAQVTRLSLFNSKLSQSLSLHNLASSFSSEGSSPSHTPTRESPSPATSQSSLKINLSTSLQALN